MVEKARTRKGALNRSPGFVFAAGLSFVFGLVAAACSEGDRSFGHAGGGASGTAAMQGGEQSQNAGAAAEATDTGGRMSQGGAAGSEGNSANGGELVGADAGAAGAGAEGMNITP